MNAHRGSNIIRLFRPRNKLLRQGLLWSLPVLAPLACRPGSHIAEVPALPYVTGPPLQHAGRCAKLPGMGDSRNRTGRNRLASLKAWAARLKRDVVALWLAARDPRTPWHAKALAGFVAAYALSPIDLIPDFIPVLGWLDDLLIVPAGIWLAQRTIPPALLAEFRARAASRDRPRSRVAAVLIVALWLAAAGLILWLWLRR